MTTTIKGIGVSKGISIAKPYHLNNEVDLTPVKPINTEADLQLFNSTFLEVQKQIEEIIKVTLETIPEKAEIFKAHLEIVKDEEITNEIIELINGGSSCSQSINDVFMKYHQQFQAMNDPYLKERAADVQDICRRFLSISLNKPLPNLLLIKEECIILAHDLTPSETALLNKKYIKGFITEIGGSTSHSAIMARAIGIPAIVSAKGILTHSQATDLIAMDGESGEISLDIKKTSKEFDLWTQKVKSFELREAETQIYLTRESITEDGKEIHLKANIGSPKDLEKVLPLKVDAVGLFRTEFLYMDAQNWPTEEEQYKSYSEVVSQLKETTIRTLDIGGDKHLDYFEFPQEMNPFLGYRALRMTMDKKDIFRTQIRALLRAAKHGNLKIMFPMVATVDEFKGAEQFIKKVTDEMKKEGIEIGKCKLGMMVEIPSAAILADSFSEVSDFFSVGSNDLIQYTHAADRMSREVSYLYQPNNPSILSLINMTCMNKKNKDVSVCGEMASKPISVILLIGLGVKHLSMSASEILSIKRVICNVSYSKCKELAQKALEMSSDKEVEALVKDAYPDLII